MQGERFDFLLGMDGQPPEVLPGEVYVPVCYRGQYGLAEGDTMVIDGRELVIAGFIRDGQMNSMMASSKRFLVSEADYESLKTRGEEQYRIEFLLREGTDTNAFQTAYSAQSLPANDPAITKPLIRMMNALSDGTMIFVIFLVSVVVLLISMLCIHFILERGEMLAVMDPSGSEKSTPLYNVSGVDQPSGGKVWLGDTEITGLSEDEKAGLRLRRMGFVFQQMNMMANLNILDNILLPSVQANKGRGGKSRAELTLRAR